MKKIDPNRMIIGMIARACSKCTHIQHVFFKSQEEFDTWECPECKERKTNEDLQLQQSVDREVQEPS